MSDPKSSNSTVENAQSQNESEKRGKLSMHLTNLETSTNTNVNLKHSMQEIPATKNNNHSSNSADTSQMEDEQPNGVNRTELDNRLEEFIKSFVEQIEEKITIAYLILKGKLNKPGKFADKFSGLFGQASGVVIGGLLGFLIGFPIGPFVASSTKSLAEKIAANLGNQYHQEKDVSLRNLINLFQTDKRSFRATLVKIGYDIFQSFELQCMRITTIHGPERAMEFLARDAANRAINYCVKNKSCSLGEGVIFGDSKVEPILGIPVYSSKLKTPGFEITYQHNTFMKDWRTASLFEKVGIVRYGIIPKKLTQYFQKVDGTSKVDKYGCRRLLSLESWVDLKEKFELVRNVDKNEHFVNYEYILNPEDSESKTNHILDKINEGDINLLYDRLKEVIIDVEQSIVNHLRDASDSLDEHSKTLENIISILVDIRESPANYLRKFEQELEETRKIMSEIKENINQVRQKQDIANEGIEYLVRKSKHQGTEHYEYSDEFRLEATVIYFIERTIEMEHLNKILQNKNEPEVTWQVISITGLGGIGKTELAKRYALNNVDYYKSRIWLNAETNEYLRVDVEKLAYKLDLDTKERETEDILDDIYKKLAIRGKSLFIFDNAEEYNDIKMYLFRTSFFINSIHVIITSRNQKWEAGDKGRIKVLKLKSFTPDEATNFIKKFLKLEDNSHDDDIEQLIEELQYFPLALRQAAVYIEQVDQTVRRRGKGKFTVGDYLETWKQNQSKLLDQGYYEDCVYTKTVLTTWKTTTEKIETNGENGKLAIEFLNIIAFFPPDMIPIELVFSILVSDIEKLWNAIELLNQYSMIELKDGKANIHRLVQQVTRFELDKPDSFKQDYFIEVVRKIIKILTKIAHDDHILDKMVMNALPFVRTIADSVFSNFASHRPEETQLPKIGMDLSRHLDIKITTKLMLKEALRILKLTKQAFSVPQCNPSANF